MVVTLNSQEKGTYDPNSHILTTNDSLCIEGLGTSIEMVGVV